MTPTYDLPRVEYLHSVGPLGRGCMSTRSCKHSPSHHTARPCLAQSQSTHSVSICFKHPLFIDDDRARNHSLHSRAPTRKSQWWDGHSWTSRQRAVSPAPHTHPLLHLYDDSWTRGKAQKNQRSRARPAMLSPLCAQRSDGGGCTLVRPMKC